MKELGVTDDQRKKMDDINFNAAKARIQAQGALQVQRMELERLMRADNPDRAAIDKKIQEIAQSQATLMRSTITARLDNQAVLTKDQRDKLKDLVQKRVAAARARQTPPPAKPAPPPAPPAPPRPKAQ